MRIVLSLLEEFAEIPDVTLIGPEGPCLRIRSGRPIAPKALVQCCLEGQTLVREVTLCVARKGYYEIWLSGLDNFSGDASNKPESVLDSLLALNTQLLNYDRGSTPGATTVGGRT